MDPRAFVVRSLAAVILASTSGIAMPAGEPAGPVLESAHLAIRLAPEEAGLGVISLEHRSGGGAPEAFVSAPPAGALLWRLVLRGPGAKADEIRIDNRVPCHRTARIDAAQGAAFLRWEGIDAGAEPAVIDVSVEIRLDAGGSTALWRIEVANRSKTLGPWEVHFPALAGFGEKGKIDLGIPRGNWGILERGANGALGGYYPSNDWPMQFILAGKGDRGFLLTARDGEAWPKRFSVDPGAEMHFLIYPEDMGKPGAGVRLPFDIALDAYRGSWWTGAKRYRAWALGAPWSKRGPIAGRKDFPEALRRVGLWWLGGGAAGESVPRMKEAAARFDVPLAIHWYNWHQIPFDVNYPEYFPTKPGFAAGVKELVAAGQTVMPYINGRLWDTGGPNFPGARPAACKQPGGAEIYIETYGSGAKLAPMCPATKSWQAKVGEIILRLGEECGVNAVYIDQIGSAGPVLCHDPSHGHALGGGRHWVGGYREMLEPLRAFAAGRGMALTTENNAEPYMDTIDGYLIWLPRTDNEIPLTTAVYSGRAVYFSSPSREGMEPDAFAMLQGRDLIWGCQLGWMGFDLLAPTCREQAEYLLQCGRMRKALESYLLEGELVGELDLLEAPPFIESKWGAWQGTYPARLPSIQTAVWKAPDGRLALLFANLSKEPRAAVYDLDASRWGLAAPKGKLRFARLRPAGRDDLGVVEARGRRTENLGPREILAIEAVVE